LYAKTCNCYEYFHALEVKAEGPYFERVLEAGIANFFSFRFVVKLCKTQKNVPSQSPRFGNSFMCTNVCYDVISRFEMSKEY
jgi:hypothetical protein